MTRPQRPALRYHGGKWRLARHLIRLFPRHRIYTEAFGGGASVLLRKPRAYSEVYNDLDGEIVNVFRVLQDRWANKELQWGLERTAYSRAEFELSYVPVENGDEIERARRTIVRSFMGFGSASAWRSHRTGFRSGAHRSGTTPAHDWVRYPQHLDSFYHRLRGVVIEERDAARALAQHDTAETLHYVDPPYPRSTRTTNGDAYAHEMTDDDHRALARLLRSLEGMVILSGYPCELYDGELYPDWHRTEIAAVKSSQNASVPATEVVWLNEAAREAQRQRSLFSGVNA